MNSHNTVESNITDTFVQQCLVVNRDHCRNVDLKALFEVILRFVGFHTEHGKDKAPVEMESPGCIHTVTKHHGQTLSTHFKMVVMGNILFYFPTDRTFGSNIPAILILSRKMKAGKNKEEREESKFFVCHGYLNK